MSENDKSVRLLAAAKELNIGTQTVVDFLKGKGFSVENKPTTKLSGDMYDTLLTEFQGNKRLKEEASKIHIGEIRRTEPGQPEPVSKPAPRKEFEEEVLIKNISALELKQHALDTAKEKEAPKAPKPVVEAPAPSPAPVAAETAPAEDEKLAIKVVGKINLETLNTKVRPDKKTSKAEEKKEDAPAPVAPKAEEKKEAPAPVAETPSAPVVEEPVAETPAAPVAPAPAAPAEEVKDETIRARAAKLGGTNVIGKIDLSAFEKKKQPVASSSGQSAADANKRKRKRKDKGTPVQGQPSGTGNSRPIEKAHPNRPFNRTGAPGGPKPELDDKQIQEQIKATLARLSGAGKSGKFADRAKFRRQKRDDKASAHEDAMLERDLQSKVLKVTEFVTANELAKMMEVNVTQIISTCMQIGMFVSINQRLDAETLSLLAEEFGYTVEFVTVDAQETIIEEEDSPEDLLPRAPIITVMGHVDHGKTSLLDYIRKANVISGEAGGITQHIGAYEVVLEDGRKIAFLDTPGHEAFTAMRARGAKITDIVIIVIAADDSVMPQTREAINHAQAAGVPLIFAFNKIDKPGANANKIREELATMNILVEDWGGKYQCQEISAKSGLNVDLLLEKVLLEAEILELKANPNKRAQGAVVEAELDKGRGIVTTILVQSGTLRVGDPILAGCHSGRVKALTNERGQRIKEAGPSTPVQVLGFTGAPQAGDKFNVMETEPEAREIANKRLQLQREQGLRTQKHITLDEIGRRLAIGNFKELNIIVKGDVDGSVEALADSLLKLSTTEIQVNVLHKGVGQISESDVILASASDAIIIGFQVRPSVQARKLAETEQIDIRLYSIIYDAINEIKAAMEGMLAPDIEEKIVANVEIREVFKISKVGTIAGCMVTDGKISRNTKVRLIREGVVIYTGELDSLKRFKDDVKEVATGYECGLNIKNFNDLKIGDVIEGYEQVEVKRKLA